MPHINYYPESGYLTEVHQLLQGQRRSPDNRWQFGKTARRLGGNDISYYSMTQARDKSVEHHGTTASPRHLAQTRLALAVRLLALPADARRVDALGLAGGTRTCRGVLSIVNPSKLVDVMRRVYRHGEELVAPVVCVAVRKGSDDLGKPDLLAVSLGSRHRNDRTFVRQLNTLT